MMNPAAYLGKTVTITASVARQFAPTAFTVDQNRSTAQGEVLVIASMLTEMPAPNAYVTVIGEAVAFDPADVSKRLKGGTLTLPPDAVTAFLGKPAIVATAIIASNMTDLTKRKPDPMSPDDEKLSAIMKQVSPAATALRAAATASDATAAKEKTAELKKLFTDAQSVFQGRNIMTAVIFSSDAIKYVDAADAAAAAGRWPDVVAAAASLTQTCTTCHNAHRVRQDDGTYRLKTGGH
jgi:cytochrome c556